MNNNDNMIYETLKKLIDNDNQHKRKKESKDNLNQETTKRKVPSYIYLDEKDNQIKEIPLSKLNLDSAANAYINRTMKQSPAKLIHDSIFHDSCI